MIELCHTLRHRMAALAETGADGFDPAGWRYIASLVQRTEGKPGSVQQQIAQIALSALDDYQAGFDREQARAADMMARAVTESPEATQQMKRLFETGDFKGLRRIAERRGRRNRPSLLMALSHRIERNAQAREKKRAGGAFDDLLQQQESEVLQSLGQAASPEEPPQSPNETDLNPLRLFRKTLAALNSDRLVSLAVKERPENAGPLNSQMLATQSLFIMRRLSPNYLNRFISYIDTLLWLEQVGEETKARAEKKRHRFRTK